MGFLTGTIHGDSANSLVGYYLATSRELEKQKHYFMSAIALAFAVEASLLAYLLVEFCEPNGEELKIPDNVAFSELIEAVNVIDVLSAPIDTASHVRDDDARPRHVAKDVVDKIRRFRNLIHPAASIKQNFDPRLFGLSELAEYRDMYESVAHSLIYNL